LEWSINATTESALGVPRLADLCRTGLRVHKTRREANRCVTRRIRVPACQMILAVLDHALQTDNT
jgi:hypothetical protein